MERTSHGEFLGATFGTETFTDLDYAADVALLAEILKSSSAGAGCATG